MNLNHLVENLIRPWFVLPLVPRNPKLDIRGPVLLRNSRQFPYSKREENKFDALDPIEKPVQRPFAVAKKTNPIVVKNSPSESAEIGAEFEIQLMQKRCRRPGVRKRKSIKSFGSQNYYSDQF